MTTAEPVVGVKDDSARTRYDLVPPHALDAVARVLTFGALKYTRNGVDGGNNWRLVPERRRRYFAATMRHLWAWWRGERADSETGESHLAHAICCLTFLLDEEETTK